MSTLAIINKMELIKLKIYGFGVLLVLTVFFSACSKQPTHPDRAIKSADTSALNILAENNRSTNFAVLTQYLDLGGTLYGYVDMEGDIAQLNASASAFFDQLRAIKPGEIPEKIDFKTIIERLGLHQIQGIGVSSYQQGKLFRNKTFIHAPGEPQGLIKALAGENKPFASIANAPTGADLLIEKSVDVTVIRDLIFAIANDIMGESGTQMLSAQLQKPLAGMTTIPTAKLIDSLNTRFVMVADIDTTTELIVQNTDTTIALPAVDFYMSLDNLGWLIDDLAVTFGQMPQLTFIDEQTTHKVTSNLPFPAPWNHYSPVILHDKVSKQLIIASSPEFLKRCLTAESAIVADAEFKAATQGLPLQGNHFQYVSQTVGKVGLELLNSVLEQQQDENTKTALSFYRDALPDTNYSTASAAQILAEGFLVISNSETSHKSSISTLAAGNPVSIGLLAAMAIPAFNKVRETSQQKAILNNLRMIAAAGDQYMLEQGVTRVSYRQLIKDDYINDIKPVDGESYDELIWTLDGEKLEVTTREGIKVNFEF